jgi:predicted peptidase
MIRKNITSYIILFLLLLALPMIAPAQESKIITTKFQSKALSGNLLGISISPNIYIYLPLSYESSGQSYPVVYLLHGSLKEASRHQRKKSI